MRQVLTLFIFIGGLWALRNFREEEVLRCEDQIIDTGERTSDGRKILRLIRENCRWEPFEEPDFDARPTRIYELDSSTED